MTEQTAVSNGRLLYGCMGLGGDWSTDPHEITDVEAAAEAIEAAMDIGVTLFDHADIYRHGKAEAVFGEVLAGTSGLRERIQLQTKCGIRLNERGLETHYDLSADAIVERVNGSLERLRTDYVDILLLHRPDPLMDPAEVAAAVGKLMADGKVRALGVSNMSAAQIEFLQDSLETPVVANQLELSLLKRDWLESTVLVNHPDAHSYSFPHGTLEYCARQGITLQAYGALARGHYTGNPPERPTAGRERHGCAAGGAGPRKGHHGGGGAAGMADEASGRDRAGHWQRQPGPDPCLRRGRSRGRDHDPGRVVPAVGHGPRQQHPLNPTSSQLLSF